MVAHMHTAYIIPKTPQNAAVSFRTMLFQQQLQDAITNWSINDFPAGPLLHNVNFSFVNYKLM